MFQRRLIIFIAFLLLALGVIIARLAWLQLVVSRDYIKLTRVNQQHPPEWLDNTIRGTIYDFRNHALAQDETSYDLYIHYNITRLYDPEFRQEEQDRYLRENPGKDPLDARLYLEENFDSQQQQADLLLEELANRIGIPVQSLLETIRQINEKISTLRLSIARRNYCRQTSKPFTPTIGREQMNQEFAAVEPDESVRKKWIQNTLLREMQQFHKIRSSLPKDQALAIEDMLAGTIGQSQPAKTATEDLKPFIAIRIGKGRKYPYHQAACHLIGQMRSVPDEVVAPAEETDSIPPTHEDLVRYHLGDQQGAFGCEYLFESILRGSRGWVQYDRNGNEKCRLEQAPGQDVRLTIDIELHKRIQQIFQGDNDLGQSYLGAAVIIDVPTGEIRAAVSIPQYDLNTYNEKYLAIINDPFRCWCNRAIAEIYETGSTIKPTNLLGGLETKTVTPDQTFNCDINNLTWTGKPTNILNHGWVDSKRAIKVSCNYYFVRLGQLMGTENLVHWLKKSGFAHPIIAWPEGEFPDRANTAFREASGYVAPIGREFPPHPRFISIGRNEMMGTIVQIANSIATIARDGVYLAPVLSVSPPAPTQPRFIASSQNARVVQSGMRAAIYQDDGYLDHGTAYEAFHPLPWPEEEVELFGKTGSTQFSLFAGFARDKTGRTLAIAVIAEVEAAGGEVAAILGKEIFIQCGELDYLPKAQELTE
jgi:cell division protein FtsI/penicillin-binding protein 2